MIGDALLPPACPACYGAAGPAERAWLCLPCHLRMRPLQSPKCERCWSPLGTGVDRRTAEGRATCTDCERWPAVLHQVRSATRMDGSARTLVHRLKYDGWESLAAVMARRMVPLVADLSADWLVPIPTTAWRKRVRGYNQAERIAVELGRSTNAPVADSLTRRPSRGTQVALQPLERLANVHGAFSLLDQEDCRFRNAQIVLVDDVLTTGATAAAAAAVLQRSGARSVSMITFARALPARRTVC